MAIAEGRTGRRFYCGTVELAYTGTGLIEMEERAIVRMKGVKSLKLGNWLYMIIYQ